MCIYMHLQCLHPPSAFIVGNFSSLTPLLVPARDVRDLVRHENDDVADDDDDDDDDTLANPPARALFLFQVHVARRRLRRQRAELVCTRALRTSELRRGFPPFLSARNNALDALER